MTRAALGFVVVCGMLAHVPHANGGAGIGVMVFSLVFAPTEASTPEVLLALAAIGLDAEALAAAGLDGTSVTAMLASLRGEPESVAEANAAMTAWREAEDAARLLQEQASLTGDSPELTQQVETISALVESTKHDWLAKRAVFLGVVEAVAASAEGASCGATLVTLSDNAERRAPVEYRVVVLTDAEWAELRTALSDESAGVQVSEAGAALLESVQNSSTFSSASSALSTNLASVSEAIATEFLQSLPSSE